MRYRISAHIDTKSWVPVYGVEAHVRGVWCNCASGGEMVAFPERWHAEMMIDNLRRCERLTTSTGGKP